MRKAFYVTMICTMLCLFGAALFFLCDGETMDTSLYLPMAPELRTAEFEALKVAVVKPVSQAQEYFDVLSRINRLSNACHIAEEREKGKTAFAARGMVLDLNFLEREFVGRLSANIAESEQFRMASTAYRDSPMHPLSRPFHPNPWAGVAWFLFYFGSIPFVMAHYFIRLRAMECRPWLEALTNWKFPLWVLLWPIGFFRYPRETSVKEQLVRAYRLAVFVLSSVLACFTVAVKQVSAQEKDDSGATSQGKTLHLDFSTITWPKYLGSNGGVFHPAPVQQTSLSFPLPKGFYAAVWNSVPLGDRHASPNFGYELDFSAGWNGKVKWLKLSGDVTYVGVTPLRRIRGDVLQISGRAGHEFALTKRQSVEPFVWVRGVLPVRGSAPRHGVFLHGGLHYHLTATRRLDIDSGAEVVHDTGAFGFQPGYFGRANLNGTLKLGRGWSLKSILQFSTPLTHVSDGRRTQLVLGGGLAYSR